MNIFFLTTHLNRGGITSYLYSLTKGLRHKGHNIFIGSSGGNRAEDFQRLNAQLIHLNIKTKSELDPRIYFALGKLKKLFRQNHIDVVHSQTRITQVMGARLHKSIKVPFVSTCHGYFKRRLGRRLFPCWGQRVIAISDPVRINLKEKFRVSEEKICLVRNGVDLKQYVPIPIELRKKNRQRLGFEDEFVIGLVARLSSVKGQDVLLQSLKLIKQKAPKAKVLLSGEGREEASLRRLVNELGLENDVCFSKTPPSVYDELAACDIFVMPSREEGLGLSIAEAQASGLAVIGSRVGGIPSLIQHEKTGLLVDKENPQQLADAIIRLINNTQLRIQLEQAGRIHVEKNFDVNTMVEETIACYEAVKL